MWNNGGSKEVAMDLQDIGSRALRTAIQENRASFPAQAPAFSTHSRAEIQWRISVLYFVRGWSIRDLAERYGLCSARVQQLLSAWRKYAISANYIQEIPPEGDPVAAGPEIVRIEENREPRPLTSAPIQIETGLRKTPDQQQEEPRRQPGQRVSIHLPKGVAAFYEHPQLFGMEVGRRFPSAKFDIREAGSCFALGRNTACVFHLARAAQVTVRCLCRHLGCASYVESLPAMIDQAESFLQDRIECEQVDEHRLEYNVVALAALRAFREALENSYPGPAGAYDEPRARQAMETGRSLMQHLALQLCEQGVVLGFTQASWACGIAALRLSPFGDRIHLKVRYHLEFTSELYLETITYAWINAE
jgi:hypothetical protein